jgi:hypothetical protein
MNTSMGYEAERRFSKRGMGIVPSSFLGKYIGGTPLPRTTGF